MGPRWEVLQSREVQEWLTELDESVRLAVERKVELLAIYGTQLHRPHVDHVKGSRYPNMKELRITSRGPIRILFCFDTQRRAVLLIAGWKSTHKNWYDRMIPRADALMDDYLQN